MDSNDLPPELRQEQAAHQSAARFNASLYSLTSENDRNGTFLYTDTQHFRKRLARCNTDFLFSSRSFQVTEARSPSLTLRQFLRLPYIPEKGDTRHIGMSMGVVFAEKFIPKSGQPGWRVLILAAYGAAPTQTDVTRLEEKFEEYAWVMEKRSNFGKFMQSFATWIVKGEQQDPGAIADARRRLQNGNHLYFEHKLRGWYRRIWSTNSIGGPTLRDICGLSFSNVYYRPAVEDPADEAAANALRKQQADALSGQWEATKRGAAMNLALDAEKFVEYGQGAMAEGAEEGARIDAYVIMNQFRGPVKFAVSNLHWLVQF